MENLIYLIVLSSWVVLFKMLCSVFATLSNNQNIISNEISTLAKGALRQPWKRSSWGVTRLLVYASTHALFHYAFCIFNNLILHEFKIITSDWMVVNNLCSIAHIFSNYFSLLFCCSSKKIHQIIPQRSKMLKTVAKKKGFVLNSLSLNKLRSYVLLVLENSLNNLWKLFTFFRK